MRTLVPCVYSTLHTAPWHHSARPVGAARLLLSVGDSIEKTTEEEQEDLIYASSTPVQLKDIFAPRRAPHDSYGSGSSIRPGTVGLSVGGKAVPLHRLDRLQEVANLALEDRPDGPGGAWGCADIGADHGLLAICLHANGANVIAGDRAAGPLDVARENARLYLQYAEEVPVPTAAAPTALTSSTSTYTGKSVGVAGSGRPGGSEAADAARAAPRLECRLGDGLAVLEAGEVDTVCIAGVGVKTMIQILSAKGHGREKACPDALARRHQQRANMGGAALSSLGVERLVLQPMDPRLEYLRDLRVWLRENGWRIKQETIVSTSGKGGNHAFVTLRADLAKPERNPKQERAPTSPAATTTTTTTTTVEWPGGQQGQSDWLGDYLLARAVDGGSRTQGVSQRPDNNRPEALTFLAYLRHQRDWLRAIERARSVQEEVATPESVVVAGVNSALVAVTAAVQAAGEEEEGRGGRDRLVTARRWQKFAES